MVAPGSFALLLETVAFLIVAVIAGWEYHWSRQESAVARDQEQDQEQRREMTLLQTEEAESGNNGTRARHQMNIILASACTAKALTLAVVWYWGRWVLFTAVSDLFYLVLYGSLVLLYSEMRHILVFASSHFAVKLGVLFSLAGVLLLSLVVCTARWATDSGSRQSMMLRKFLYLELGITYLVMFGVLVYFGVTLCMCLMAANKRLLYRISVLTFVCGLAMSTKGALFVAAAAYNSDTDALVPTSLGRDRFEALIALEDLVPSITIAYLTARGKGRRLRAQVLPPESTVLPRWDSLDNSSININIPYPGGVPSTTPGAWTVPFPYRYGPSSLQQGYQQGYI